MRTILKKVICIILTAMAVCTMSVQASAAISDNSSLVQPLWDYSTDADVSITFSGTSGTASASVKRIYGVTTSLEGTLTVYKKVGTSWVQVGNSVSGTSTRILLLELPFTGTSKTQYKAVFEFTAYSGSLSESDSLTYTITCP